MPNSTETDVAVLKNQMTQVLDTVKSIETKLDSTAYTYVTRTEFETYKLNLDKQVDKATTFRRMAMESAIKTLIPILLIGLMFIMVAYINSVLHIGMTTK